MNASSPLQLSFLWHSFTIDLTKLWQHFTTPSMSFTAFDLTLGVFQKSSKEKHVS